MTSTKNSRRENCLTSTFVPPSYISPITASNRDRWMALPGGRLCWHLQVSRRSMISRPLAKSIRMPSPSYGPLYHQAAAQVDYFGGIHRRLQRSESGQRCSIPHSSRIPQRGTWAMKALTELPAHRNQESYSLTSQLFMPSNILTMPFQSAIKEDSGTNAAPDPPVG